MKTNQVKLNQKGWLLVESLIAIAIFSIISVVFVKMIFETFRAWQQAQSHNELQSQLISSLNFVEKELRAATQILDASSNSITFKGYGISESSPPDQIRYFVSSNKLKRGIILPTGEPPDYTYDPNSETIKTITNFIVGGQPNFRYYDQSGILLLEPVGEDQVTLVEVILSLDNDTVKPPPAVTASTKIHLRNRKTNL
jgi:type II secretory pathway pseudopilin PulG